MTKIEQMEIMKQQISSKCITLDCYDCPLYANRFCYSYRNERDYQVMREHCKVLGIDISELEDLDKINADAKENTEMKKEFTIEDIRPGYLLEVFNVGEKKKFFAIAMGGENGIEYYEIKKTKDGGFYLVYSFSQRSLQKDFIVPDFYNHFIIEKVYGYVHDNVIFSPNGRTILWSKGKDKSFLIDENGQCIHINPNGDSYFSNEPDGDIYIEDSASYFENNKDRYIAIKRENLPRVIETLQEIQNLYDEYELNELFEEE